MEVIETYLLTCMCYLEMNPVRAAMVHDPAHYRWTHYRANALGQVSSLLSPHPLYLALGATDRARRVAYRRLFRPPLDPETISDLRLALIPQPAVGNERFYAKIERMTGQRREARPRGRSRLDANVRGKPSLGRESWHCENIRAWPPWPA